MIIFVTAFVDIGRSKWNTFKRSNEEYLTHFYKLQKHIQHPLIVYVDRTQFTIESTDNLTVIDINSVETYLKDVDAHAKIMKSASYLEKVPPRRQRLPEHSCAAYNCTQLSKIHFVRDAMKHRDGTHYAWIDFGFLKDGVHHLPHTLRTCDKIQLHCFSRPESGTSAAELLQTDKICISGGAFVVPSKLMDTLFMAWDQTYKENLSSGITDDDQSLWHQVYWKLEQSIQLYQHPEWFALFRRIRANNPLSEVHSMPYFSKQRCEEIIEKACAMNAWTSNRHKNYPTTDIPVHKINNLDMEKEINDISVACMHKFGLDGHAKAFDLFVVKYEVGAQDRLALHRDASELSFVALLSDPKDYEGGGTYYETTGQTVMCGQGDVVFHCGKMRHAGKQITRGKRFILIGFFDVFSPEIRKPPKDMSNSLTDRRYIDFLYRHGTRSGVRICIKVINLLHRHEKLAAILRRIQALDVPPMWSVDVQVVVADEGKNNHGFKQWVTTDTHGCSATVTKYWQRPIKQGEVGCFVSHMKAIQTTQLGSNEYLLILEDDADFYTDLLYRIDNCLQEIMPWDCIDLGGLSMDGENKPVTTYLHQRKHVYQTHCILYNSGGLAKLSGIDYTHRVVPFDEFLPAIRGVHPRKDIHALFADVPRLRMFYPYERMSTQVAGVHDTEGVAQGVAQGKTEESEEFERVGEDSDMTNYYIFRDKTAHNVNKKIQTANDNMWKFQLCGVKSGNVAADTWNLCVTRRKKVVCICLEEGAHLQFQHNMRSLSGPSTVVFPAYLSFKCDGGYSCFFGHGSSFF